MRAPTLLVIEDSEDQAVLLTAAARAARPGLEIRSVSDGLEGISYLAGLPPYDDPKAYPAPDLVVLDLYMPEVDGFEVLTWMNDRDQRRPTPVVVLTSSTDEHDADRALSLGAAAVFVKPAGIEELAEVVAHIVETWIGRGAMIGAHLWASG